MRPCPARVELVHDRSDKVDSRCARLAASQWSVLDVDELRACGLTREAIRTRVRNGRLHPLYRGVYAVGPPQPLARRLLAGGRQGVRHRTPCSATTRRQCLWCLLKWDYRDPEVTAPTLRRHEGIRTHTSQNIERTYRNGHPRHAPAANADRPLLDAAVRHAAQSGQRSPQPAARQAARTRDRQPPRRAQAPSGRRLGRAHEKRVRRPRPRPPRRPPEAAGQPAAPRLRPRLPLARPPRHPRSRRPQHPRPTARQSRRQGPPAPSWKQNGYQVLRVTWRQATTQPQKLQARLRGTLEHRT